MVSLNEYIARINNNDTTLKAINLGFSKLNDTDANRLMQALREMPLKSLSK